jgi:uncharacterized membrane protein YkoI
MDSDAGPRGPSEAAGAVALRDRHREETPLTGDIAARIEEAALAGVAGAKVLRVETDADGAAAYEAHLVKADGTPVTVYVDRQFDVVSVESR